MTRDEYEERRDRQRQQTRDWYVRSREDPAYMEMMARRRREERASGGGTGNTVALRDAASTRESAFICPCCSQSVDVPSLDMVVSNYGVRPMEARVLRAVWKGKGMPVPTERIFSVMYEDSLDDWPSYASMYSAFKVALCRLRARIAGSGVDIVTVGYRKGYKLVMEGVKK